MTRILRANFTRLWKSKAFWVCVIIAVAVSIFDLFDDIVHHIPWTIEFIISRSGISALLFAPVFASLFLGTDYACGTIRNKLSAGHSRVTVYFSNLITVSVGCLLMIAFYCVLPIAVSSVQGAKLGVEVNKFMLEIAILIAAAVALASVFTILGMLISSKALTTTVTIVLAFVMLVSSMTIIQSLEEPEFYSGIIIEVDGTERYAENEPNPRYVKPGLKRDIFTAVTDIMPYGHVIRFAANDLQNPERYPLYSLGVIAVTTAAGVLVFRRKDLK